MRETDKATRLTVMKERRKAKPTCCGSTQLAELETLELVELETLELVELETLELVELETLELAQLETLEE